jgi:murein DD-endopeptidase MepM/ murein hydrolase activator NlpD
MIKIFLFSSIIISFAFSSNVVDGFDYPFGNRGYDENNTIVIKEIEHPTLFINEKNLGYDNPMCFTGDRWNGFISNGWYNYQDVGSYFDSYGGLHPGEDWHKGPDDIGEDIYSVANGKILLIDTVRNDNNHSKAGYKIVIEHELPNTDIKLYSIYLHITNLENSKKVIKADKFYFRKKSENYDTAYEIDTGTTEVKRGDKIASISNLEGGMSPHLHFEIRLKTNNTEWNLIDIYPNDNSWGYYTQNKQTRIFKKDELDLDIESTINIMKQKDGIIDPSDFIESYRPNMSQDYSNIDDLLNSIDNKLAFQDIEKTVYKKSIISLYNLGLIKNSCKFRPADNVSQYEFLVLLTRLLYPSLFVNNKSYKQEFYFEKLKKIDSIKIDNISLKNKDKAITRGEVAQVIYYFLWNFIKDTDNNWVRNIKIGDNSGLIFIFNKKTGFKYNSLWNKENGFNKYSAFLKALNISQSMKYEPSNNINRGEMAIMINRIYKFIIQNELIK